jgi:hypothetical protein
MPGRETGRINFFDEFLDRGMGNPWTILDDEFLNLVDFSVLNQVINDPQF